MAAGPAGAESCQGKSLLRAPGNLAAVCSMSRPGDPGKDALVNEESLFMVQKVSESLDLKGKLKPAGALTDAEKYGVVGHTANASSGAPVSGSDGPLPDVGGLMGVSRLADSPDVPGLSMLPEPVKNLLSVTGKVQGAPAEAAEPSTGSGELPATDLGSSNITNGLGGLLGGGGDLTGLLGGLTGGGNANGSGGSGGSGGMGMSGSQIGSTDSGGGPLAGDSREYGEPSEYGKSYGGGH